jgi:DNA-binding CsgD family transcriptional regulator
MPTSALIRAIIPMTQAGDVLNALHKSAVTSIGVNVLAAWPLPLRWDFSATRDIIFHDSVPAAFRQEHRLAMKKYGPSLMTQTVWHNPLPFTFTDAMRKLQPTGSDRWIFDLLQEHGIRDGFYCAYGSWTMVYWSNQVLKLKTAARMTLDAYSAIAVYRLKELMAQERLLAAAKLSSRELTVLRHLSLGHDPANIAEQLGLSENSVRTYVKRAAKKLKARSSEQTVALAVRQRLI